MYNLHTIKSTCFKWTIQWFLYIYRVRVVQTKPQPNLRTFPSLQKNPPAPGDHKSVYGLKFAVIFWSHLQPQVTTNLSLVSKDLPFLDISCKWMLSILVISLHHFCLFDHMFRTSFGMVVYSTDWLLSISAMCSHLALMGIKHPVSR